MSLNIFDKGENNVIDIDSRDQHSQAGKIYINGDNNYIRIGRGCVSDKDMHIVIESNCRFDVGEHVRLSMANIYVGPSSILRIGDRTASPVLSISIPSRRRRSRSGRIAPLRPASG